MPTNPSHFHLFQKRVLALENEYRRTRRAIKSLLHRVRHDPDTTNPAAIRSQLDLLDGLIRLNREQSAFYIKLGSFYDTLRTQEDFIAELSLLDPQAALAIVRKLDQKWQEE
jgi:hypothetical protein